MTHFDYLGRKFETTEMDKLIKMLAVSDVPHEVRTLASSYGNTKQVAYPSFACRICDAVCHSGSYGHEHGLLEIMGLVEDPVDDVEGYLTAEQVFMRMWKDYHGF